jgi:hypothetical protein
VSDATGALVAHQRTNRPEAAVNPVDAVAGAFPIGVYEEDLVVAAGRTLAEVVRYLNHATASGEVGLSSTDGLYQLVGALDVTMRRLPQLLEQLSARTRALGEVPGLAVDSLGPVPVGGAREVARLAFEELAAASTAAGYSGWYLDRAHVLLSRLYLSGSGGGGGDG